MTPAQHKTIARAIGLEHLSLTGRGTTALWACLRAMVPPKAEVLVPANVCEVVIASIRQAELLPRYVDVDPVGGNCMVDDLEQAWRPQCKGLIAVHNYGTPLAIDQVVAWAREKSLIVIEDCCNALGAEWQGRPVGTFGDVAVHSFGTGKILDVGFGGLLASADPQLVERCHRLNVIWPPWGESQRKRDEAFQACLRVVRQHKDLRDPAIYDTLYSRYTPALLASAPDDLADRIARAITTLPDQLDQRRERAARCRKRLADERIRHREWLPGDVHWRYTCHVPQPDRDQLVARVRERGLPISTWFPAVQRFFPNRQPPATLAGAYTFEKTVINLFVSPDTDDKTLDASADAVLSTLDTREPVGQAS